MIVLGYLVPPLVLGFLLWVTRSVERNQGRSFTPLGEWKLVVIRAQESDDPAIHSAIAEAGKLIVTKAPDRVAQEAARRALDAYRTKLIVARAAQDTQEIPPED